MNGKWERVNYNWANKKMDGSVCLFSLLDPLGSVRQSYFTISMSSLWPCGYQVNACFNNSRMSSRGIPLRSNFVHAKWLKISKLKYISCKGCRIVSIIFESCISTLFFYDNLVWVKSSFDFPRQIYPMAILVYTLWTGQQHVGVSGLVLERSTKQNYL